MLTDKEQQLKRKLKNIIKEFGHMNDTKQFVMDKFKSRNLTSLRSAWVFTENLDLDTLTNSEEDTQFLFLFSMFLNKALKEKEIHSLMNEYEVFRKQHKLYKL